MIDNEWNLIGALLLDNSQLGATTLTADDFADSRNRTFFEAIKARVDRGEPADIGTIAEDVGCRIGDLAELANNSTAASNFPAYAAMLKKHGAVRRARGVGERLAKCESPDEIEACMSDLIALSHVNESHEATHQDAVKRAVAHLELLESGMEPGLPTGLTALDNKLGGLQKSDLIIIAARSQHGKTALMMNMANALNVPAGIISGEQPAEQLGMRSLAIKGTSLQKMRTGKMDERDWNKVGVAVQQLSDSKIQIFDKGGPSIVEIMAVARQWKQRKKIEVLFIDYLQLVTGGDGGEHRLQIGDIARKLKTLAKQLQIPVVALAQIKRAVDDRPLGPNNMGRLPFTADLADSAMIEDAADQIITLYRPAVYQPNVLELEDRAFLNIAKNRHGQTGTISVEWNGEFVQFTDNRRFGT